MEEEEEMTTEVERRLVRSHDCLDIIVYRCSICGELLQRFPEIRNYA